MDNELHQIHFVAPFRIGLLNAIASGCAAGTFVIFLVDDAVGVRIVQICNRDGSRSSLRRLGSRSQFMAA